MTATNNNSNFIISDEKFIDSLAEELVVAETKTLKERIGENKIDLHNYLPPVLLSKCHVVIIF